MGADVKIADVARRDGAPDVTSGSLTVLG